MPTRSTATPTSSRSAAIRCALPCWSRGCDDNPAALRYTTTHDLFHTITGFSTNPAGEIGLFAFMIGQGFSAGGIGTLRFVRAVYTVLKAYVGTLTNRK